jgi:hypothetical protein
LSLVCACGILASTVSPDFPRIVCRFLVQVP